MNKFFVISAASFLVLAGFGCQTSAVLKTAGKNEVNPVLADNFGPPGNVGVPKVFDPKQSKDGSSAVSLTDSTIKVIGQAGTANTFAAPKTCAQEPPEMDRNVWFGTDNSIIYGEYCGEKDTAIITRLDMKGGIISTKEFPGAIGLDISSSGDKALFYVRAAKEYGFAVTALDGSKATILIKVPSSDDGSGATLLPGMAKFSPDGKKVFLAYTTRFGQQKNGERFDNMFPAHYEIYDLASGKATDMEKYFAADTSSSFFGWKAENTFVLKTKTGYETHEVE
ncbi:MAG: hypothetical protein WC641_01440 [Patescibacteria group bacterium]